jgi:hypothetical protein
MATRKKQPGRYLATVLGMETISNWPYKGETKVIDIEFENGIGCRVRYTKQMEKLGLFDGDMFRFDCSEGFDSKYRIGFGKLQYSDGEWVGSYIYRFHNISIVDCCEICGDPTPCECGYAPVPVVGTAA